MSKEAQDSHMESESNLSHPSQGSAQAVTPKMNALYKSLIHIIIRYNDNLFSAIELWSGSLHSNR